MPAFKVTFSLSLVIRTKMSIFIRIWHFLMAFSQASLIKTLNNQIPPGKLINNLFISHLQLHLANKHIIRMTLLHHRRSILSLSEIQNVCTSTTFEHAHFTLSSFHIQKSTLKNDSFFYLTMAKERLIRLDSSSKFSVVLMSTEWEYFSPGDNFLPTWLSFDLVLPYFFSYNVTVPKC